MLLPRVIPCLLLKNKGLVKTIKFGKPVYVGDPLNAIKIFNDKEVDELLFIDITATVENKPPPFEMIESIASECFMPVCYGGGIRSIHDIKRIIGLGIEKVSISSYALENPLFVKEAADVFGSQSIVVCIDVKKSILGNYEVVTHNARNKTGRDPVEYAVEMARMGAGELLINSVDRDGTMSGYDIGLIKKITASVNVPVIVCGGAGKLDDFGEAVARGGAAAVAAGSMFVFQGRHRAVLISYPATADLRRIFG